MHRILCVVMVLSLSLLVVRCSQFHSTGTAAHGDTKSVRVAIRVAPEFDTIAARAEAVVSAPDMQPITAPLVLDGDTLLTGVISNIPAGAHRFFEVFVYGFDGSTEYYGCADADISSRDTTFVTIVLRKPYGTAVINGYIEEYFPDSGHLSAMTIPYIVKYRVLEDTTGPYGVAAELATTPVYSSIPGDTVNYSWAIVQLFPDTLYRNEITGDASLTWYCYTEGRFEVMVKAFCSHGLAKTSGPLFFTVKNGAVIPDGDTGVPSFDTIPPVIQLPWNNPVTIGIRDTLDYTLVTAYDGRDGDVSRRISVTGDIIYGVSGTYHLMFSVKDAAGNSAVAGLEVRISRRRQEDYLYVTVKN